MFAAVGGVQVAQVGQLWAAFSPLSGETVLLNDASAAILEILADGPRSQADVCECLASDTDQPADVLASIVESCWHSLIDPGLVRRMPPGPDNWADVKPDA